MTAPIRRQLYRRRPPRPVLALVVLVSFLVSITAAQSSTTLFSPSRAQFNLTSSSSAFFYLPASSDRPIYLTLSLCSPPDSLSNDTATHLLPHLNTTLYASNSSSVQQPGPSALPDKSTGGTSAMSYGLGNVTLDDGAADGLWVGVWAPDDTLMGGSGGETWTFELDVTSGDFGPSVTADGGASFRFEDSDRDSALLTTTNWTAAGDTSTSNAPAYVPVIAPTTLLSTALGRSQCFIRQQRAVPNRRIVASTTTRGYGGGVRSQFEVQGLQEGTNYTAWLTENSTTTTSGNNSTRIWDPVYFATKSSTSCRLLYDLDFCPSVAYSVPSPPSLSTTALMSYFNASLSSSLAVFARTLTTFPCNSTQFGQYSVVSTCDDCYAAYRDWLCATALPRCTDAPANATLSSNSSLVDSSNGLPTWDLPASYQSSLVRSFPPASRTPAFAPQNLSTTFPSLFNSSYPPVSRNTLDETPFPYSETPPCLDVCQLVQARCPPFLNWYCPVDGGTGTAGYAQTKGVPAGDRSAADLQGSTRTERAQDRYGNVYCNALGSDLKMAAQFVGHSSSSAASSALAGSSSLFIPLFVLSSFLLAYRP
ncbi:hypothetical protein JCM21900_000708 [Sporobolomyces salmonicolor]